MSILARHWHIVSIMAAALVLRVWNLGQADFVTDEALNSFRAIGMVDFLSTEFQTTPWEWLNEPAWWLRLSFHDHPPLSFLIQHIVFDIFGVNEFAARLPFALAGTASVYLLYALMRWLSSERTALIAAGILAINNFHVWISRTGLQESLVIFFVLLALNFFVRARETPKYWYWFGLVFGLGMLTKYTYIYLLPTVLLYLFFTSRQTLSTRQFWTAWVIALVIFSPVIVYNIALYRQFGHFDLQFSYMLHQATPYWQELPGKSQAGVWGNLFGAGEGFVSSLSPAMPVLFIAALAGSIWWVMKKRGSERYVYYLMFFNIGLLLLLFTLVGPGVRFLTMLTPFIAIAIAAAFMELICTHRSMVRHLVIYAGIALMMFELFYSVNSTLIPLPYGKERIFFTTVVRENKPWGFNALEEFLTERFDHRVSMLTLQAKRPLIASLMARYAEARRRDSRYQPMRTLVIYDANLNWYPRVWYLNRRALYQGVPLITADDALKVAREQGEDFYRRAGFEEFVFIKAEDTFLSDTHTSDAASMLAQKLENEGIKPKNITNPRSATAFNIYEF